MALIENTMFGDIDKVAVAIERIKTFDPPDRPYFVAISGGKDSSVIHDLVKRSGVKARFVHSFTTIDAPQTIRFLKKNHPDVEFVYPEIKPLPAMMLKWKEPPTQLWRLCCRYYKENAGKGEFLITGVRSEESTKRKTRKMLETCMRDKTRRYLHAIIDWTELDVWEYIKSRKLPYNPLYDPPYSVKRVGCVMCPCGSNRVEEAMRIAPRIIDTWRRWMDRLHAEGVKQGWPVAKHHKTAQDLWNWWLSDKVPTDKNQMSIFED